MNGDRGKYGKETRTVRKMDRGEKREDKNWGILMQGQKWREERSD